MPSPIDRWGDQRVNAGAALLIRVWQVDERGEPLLERARERYCPFIELGDLVLDLLRSRIEWHTQRSAHSQDVVERRRVDAADTASRFLHIYITHADLR